MEFGEKDIKNFTIIGIILILGVLAFFLVRPLFGAIIGGLVLAYMFTPVYKYVKSKIRYSTLSAFLVCAVIIIIIMVLLWFLIPRLLEESFTVFSASQSVDLKSLVDALFPHATKEFSTQTALMLNNFINNAGSAILNSMSSLILNVPSILLQLAIIAIVFFFSLRDGDRLTEFIAGLSPFSKTKEGLFVRQFKDITDSIIYGIIVVGIFQGIFAGFGFFIFGIPNALFLTILAIIFSIIPLIGPSIIWIPANIYLFMVASPPLAIAYLVYNLVIVSTIDNILRSYIVARRSNISTGVVLIGILSGTLVFGTMGVLIGPLVLSYLVTLLRAYKEKRMYSLFYEE